MEVAQERRRMPQEISADEPQEASLASHRSEEQEPHGTVLRQSRTQSKASHA